MSREVYRKGYDRSDCTTYHLVEDCPRLKQANDWRPFDLDDIRKDTHCCSLCIRRAFLRKESCSRCDAAFHRVDLATLDGAGAVRWPCPEGGFTDEVPAGRFREKLASAGLGVDDVRDAAERLDTSGERGSQLSRRLEKMDAGDLVTDGGRVTCRYPRLDLHDDPEEWIEFAKETDKVLLLDTENGVVFLYYAETEEFSDGHTWRSKGIDWETGRSGNTAHSTDGLAERRIEEAVSKHRAFLLDAEETPLKDDRFIESENTNDLATDGGRARESPKDLLDEVWPTDRPLDRPYGSEHPRDTAQRWIGQAEANVERWGNQPPAVLLLALVEVIAETADDLLATAEMPMQDGMYASESYKLLSQVRHAGFACRDFLEEHFEDESGNPLPADEVPTLVHDLDRDRVLNELEDAAPLVYQLRWALAQEGDDA